jgi:hypothetical protein
LIEMKIAPVAAPFEDPKLLHSTASSSRGRCRLPQQSQAL